MRRFLLIAILAAGCSSGVTPRAALTPAPEEPVTSPEPPPVATTSPEPAPRKVFDVTSTERRQGDLDGDRENDDVGLVESNQTRDGDWRFGVRVRFAAGGEATYWYPEGYGGNDGQTLYRVVDVTGEGVGDVVLGAGTSATDGAYEVLTVVDGDLVPLRGADLWSGLFHSWGCDGRGRVYAGEAVHGADDLFRGTLTFYRVQGARLVTESSSDVGPWRMDEGPPADWDRDPLCGATE